MILLLDNHDSFTWNLVQALRVLGAEVVVRGSDAIPVEAVERLRPAAVVLSPGPGRPELAGITPAVVDRLAGRLPILGVCLGHQAIGLTLGARVVRASRPIHGKATPIRHRGEGLFAGLADPLLAGRYHSLVLDPGSLPPALAVHARAEDGTIQAVASEPLDLWGVQFHPESILTPLGPRLLEAFLDRVRKRGGR